MSKEECELLLKPLLECESIELNELNGATQDGNTTSLTEKLCSIGDSIVYRLVQWTKCLPFYNELPVTIHTQLLTHKWHQLLVLSTCLTNLDDHTNDSMEQQQLYYMNKLANQLGQWKCFFLIWEFPWEYKINSIFNIIFFSLIFEQSHCQCHV